MLSFINFLPIFRFPNNFNELSLFFGVAKIRTQFKFPNIFSKLLRLNLLLILIFEIPILNTDFTELRFYLFPKADAKVVQ